VVSDQVPGLTCIYDLNSYCATRYPTTHCHPEERSDEGSVVVLHHSAFWCLVVGCGKCTSTATLHTLWPAGAGILYIGVTGDLHRRVFQHKWKEHDGFTARYNCDRLVWFERHQFVQYAIAREKQLKGWGRSKKIALIEMINAAWVDLSREWYDCEPADYLRSLERFDA
jgi:putative endonuclease